MRVDGGVEVHDGVEVGDEELVLHPPVGVGVRHPLVLHVAGEALVQPAISASIVRNKRITKDFPCEKM